MSTYFFMSNSWHWLLLRLNKILLFFSWLPEYGNVCVLHCYECSCHSSIQFVFTASKIFYFVHFVSMLSKWIWITVHHHHLHWIWRNTSKFYFMVSQLFLQTKYSYHNHIFVVSLSIGICEHQRWTFNVANYANWLSEKNVWYSTTNEFQLTQSTATNEQEQILQFNLVTFVRKLKNNSAFVDTERYTVFDAPVNTPLFTVHYIIINPLIVRYWMKT